MQNFYKHIAIVFGLLLTLFACEKPAEPERNYTITMSNDDMVIYPADAGKTYTREFTVTPSGKNPNIEAYGNLEVKINYDDASGKGILTLNSIPEKYNSTGKAGVRIHVYQKAAIKSEFQLVPAHLSGPADPVLMGSAATQTTVNVNTNVPFAASCDSDWIRSITVSGNIVSFSVEENNTYFDRSAAINLSDETGTVTGTINITQSEIESPLKSLNEVELLLRIAHKFRDAGHESPQWKMWEEYYEAHKEEFNDPNSILYTRPLYYYTGDGCILPTNGHVAYLHLDGTTVDHPEFEIEIPEEIGYFPYMDELWCSRGGFIGNIPESFQRLSRLVDMNFCENKLSGEIPEWLASLPKLKGLAIWDNYFSGNIPESFANMPADFAFGFWGNCMDGEIPASIINSAWWNYAAPYSGILTGPQNLDMGQREGHRLWLPGEE